MPTNRQMHGDGSAIGVQVAAVPEKHVQITQLVNRAIRARSRSDTARRLLQSARCGWDDDRY